MKKLLFFLVILLIKLSLVAQDNSFPTNEVDEIVTRIQLPQIPSFRIDIVSLGAKGDSVQNCKPAFDEAMALCQKNNGGTIVVPKGIYKLDGPIHFVSNVNLVLEKDATIRFSDIPDDYLPLVLTSWEGTMLYNYSPLIYAYDCHDVAITGEGTIDGEGGEIWDSYKEKETADKMLSREMNHNSVPLEERKFGEGHFLRPPFIQFFNCKNILVEDIHIERNNFV